MKIPMQLRCLPAVYTLLVSIFANVKARCVNSRYTSLIDFEISRLHYRDFTEHDLRNATLNAYADPPSCGSVDVSFDTPLNSRTLCPWEYVRDYDPNRFPTTLIMAKCKCATCFDNYQCKPVLYTVPVLVKQCTDGVFQWIQQTQLVSVACTCSRPNISVVKRKKKQNILLDRI